MSLAFVLMAMGFMVLGLILATRRAKAVAWRRSLVAYQLRLPTGLSVAQISDWLGSLSALTHASWWWLLPAPPVVIEVTATPEGIVHHLLIPAPMREAILAAVRGHLPGIRIDDAPDYLASRPRCRIAAEWRLTSHVRALHAERAEAVATGLLSSLQPLGTGEAICHQLILTGGGTPSPLHSSDKSRQIDPEELRSIRQKHREPLLRGVGRLGIIAGSRPRAYSLLGRTFGRPRQLNAPGAQFVRRSLPERLVTRRLHDLTLPLTAWPLTLNAGEAVGLAGLPIGESVLPGLSLGAARHLPSPHGLSRHGVILADSNYPGSLDPLRLSRDDRLRHLYAVGPVGVGKSTLLASMAIQDIEAGDGLVLIDPKDDLVSDILARIPEERREDVIVLDPAEEARPLGFNVLGAGDSQQRELVADHLLSILRSLWAQNWGPRTDDILRHALVTLTHTRALDGSPFTLVEVPELLTNRAFRAYVTGQSSVPLPLRSFWAGYENLSEAERAQSIAPVLNKLRQFTTRTPLRLTLGQPRGLDLAGIIRQRKILLVSLRRGRIGDEPAYLLGSLLLAGLWQATLGRAAIPPEHRRPFWLYLDEFHQISRLAVSLADMLAEARGLGVGVTMANQQLSQLPPGLREAVLGTVRSHVVFQVGHDDARLLEPSFAPALNARDLAGLDAYEVAMRLCAGNTVRAPVTGVTRPLPATVSDQAVIRELSRQRYGQARVDVESALTSRLTTTAEGITPGRRQRGGKG